jgi:sucrose-6-phosphate hydrolase SacC (GH32 family)
MVSWEYVRAFYEPNPAWTELGEDCAVPTFFPLGRKHMLLFVSHKYGCQYYLGRHPREQFIPEQHGRMNWAGGQLIAPMSMIDAKGRRLMFGWVCEARRDASARAAGWAGVMTLPRVLTMRKDGSLGIEPVEELQALRRGHRALEGLPVAEETPLSGFEGDCLELELTVQRGSAQEFGVKVRFSPDGEEQTTIVYSWAKGTLRIDTTRSSLSPEVVQPWPCPWGVMYDNPLETRVLPFHNAPVEIRDVRVQEAPLPLRAGERLKLRVFLDRSVLEVYANGRQCLTQRIYPIQRDSLGVRLLASGGEARVERVEAWEMMGAGT